MKLLNKMKTNKLKFLKPKKEESIGQWLVNQGISAGFPISS